MTALKDWIVYGAESAPRSFIPVLFQVLPRIDCVEGSVIKPHGKVAVTRVGGGRACEACRGACISSSIANSDRVCP